MKKLLITITIFGFSLCLSSMSAANPQSAPVDSLVVKATSLVDSGYVEWKKDDMLYGYALLQRAAVISPGNKYVDYYISYAAYRLMTYGMATKDENVYKEFAGRAENGAKKLDDEYPDWSEPKILLAAIYGIEIAHSWMNAPTLGPKSDNLAEKAVSLDSTNPRAYLILGTDKLNTPGIFGGSVDKAVEYFQKSVILFEADLTERSRDLKPSWGYIDALTWLGLAYEKQERYAEALSVYRKALVADPDYARAKYVLIPAAEKKMESNKNK